MLMNIMKNLPTNESRIYVMEKDKSGCDIYIPVALVSHIKTIQDDYEQSTKILLKDFLSKQPSPPLKVA